MERRSQKKDTRNRKREREKRKRRKPPPFGQYADGSLSVWESDDARGIRDDLPGRIFMRSCFHRGRKQASEMRCLFSRGVEWSLRTAATRVVVLQREIVQIALGGCHRAVT
jgi:hypothetical protein